MVRILLIIVLSLFFSTSSNAKVVWYCIDDLVVGMDGEYKNTQKFKPERFNIKFNESDLSEVIVDGDKFKQTGNDVLMIYVDDIGSIIRFYINDDKLGYHRSRIFGMSDAIFVANGECEKF